MRERPILFRSQGVRAILDGKKNQDRRIVKPTRHPYGEMLSAEEIANEINNGTCSVRSPYGQIGDRLWVRETWSNTKEFSSHIFYKADGDVSGKQLALHYIEREKRWRPSIHMPRWASRITLKITNIRVERLNDIGADDIRKEGIIQRFPNVNDKFTPSILLGQFIDLWDGINGNGSWAKNPWVWVIEFKRVES